VSEELRIEWTVNSEQLDKTIEIALS